ncbi:hypothetical protein D9M70_474280 [compost metagenome]
MHAQHGIGDGHAFEHVDAVFEQLARGVQVVVLVQHFAQQRGGKILRLGAGAAVPHLLDFAQHVAADAFDLRHVAFHRMAEPGQAAAVEHAAGGAQQRHAVDQQRWRLGMDGARALVVAQVHVQQRQQVVARAHVEGREIRRSRFDLGQQRQRAGGVVAQQHQAEAQQRQPVAQRGVAGPGADIGVEPVGAGGTAVEVAREHLHAQRQQPQFRARLDLVGGQQAQQSDRLAHFAARHQGVGIAFHELGRGAGIAG